MKIVDDLLLKNFNLYNDLQKFLILSFYFSLKFAMNFQIKNITLNINAAVILIVSKIKTTDYFQLVLQYTSLP